MRTELTTETELVTVHVDATKRLLIVKISNIISRTNTAGRTEDVHTPPWSAHSKKMDTRRKYFWQAKCVVSMPSMNYGVIWTTE